MGEKIEGLEFWGKERFRHRSIKIQFGEEIDVIPIPDDVVVCDFCNAEITEFPVPVYLNNALCQRCFQKIKEDIKKESKR